VRATGSCFRNDELQADTLIGGIPAVKRNMVIPHISHITPRKTSHRCSTVQRRPKTINRGILSAVLLKRKSGVFHSGIGCDHFTACSNSATTRLRLRFHPRNGAHRDLRHAVHSRRNSTRIHNSHCGPTPIRILPLTATFSDNSVRYDRRTPVWTTAT
jgi:hypothetical protein